MYKELVMTLLAFKPNDVTPGVLVSGAAPGTWVEETDYKEFTPITESPADNNCIIGPMQKYDVSDKLIVSEATELPADTAIDVVTGTECVIYDGETPGATEVDWDGVSAGTLLYLDSDGLLNTDESGIAVAIFWDYDGTGIKYTKLA